MKVEKARINDVPQIYELVNSFAENDEMLPRALSEIYENLRDYFVIRDSSDRVIACVALHISWADIAEIKSLAVKETSQGEGIGTRLVEACFNEAQELGIPSVFCLTYKPVFFEKQGFRRIDKMKLPRKVWVECFRCPKFPDCGELALIYNFNQTI